MCVDECLCVCLSTVDPAPPTPPSSALPISDLLWAGWGHLFLSRPLAPGWHRGRECPPAPSPLSDTTSQNLPLTPHAEATSCVERKQEGSSAVVVSVVMFRNKCMWWDAIDTLQQWFVYFVVFLRRIKPTVLKQFGRRWFHSTTILTLIEWGQEN